MILLLAISFESARTLLILSAIFAGIGLAGVIISVAILMAAKSWVRAGRGELTSPPEDDERPADLLLAEEAAAEFEKRQHPSR